MSKVIFYFDTDETAESFYLWWIDKMQKKFKKDSKHDDYRYNIINYDYGEDYSHECNHAVVIQETLKK